MTHSSNPSQGEEDTFSQYGWVCWGWAKCFRGRHLDVETSIGEWEEILNVLARDVTTVARLDWEALDLDAWCTGLGSLLDLLILTYAVQKVIARSRLLHVLNAHMDLLADDAVAVELVHLDTDGAWGDVPDDTGLTICRGARRGGTKEEG